VERTGQHGCKTLKPTQLEHAPPCGIGSIKTPIQDNIFSRESLLKIQPVSTRIVSSRTALHPCVERTRITNPWLHPANGLAASNRDFGDPEVPRFRRQASFQSISLVSQEFRNHEGFPTASNSSDRNTQIILRIRTAKSSVFTKDPEVFLIQLDAEAMIEVAAPL
jgi:hypothetical protein